MASVSISFCSHLELEVKVTGLENDAGLYDRFVYHIYQQVGEKVNEIITYTDWNTASLRGANNFYFTFENPDYLGNNPLSPGCNYLLKLDAYYEGVRYTLPIVEFETTSIRAAFSAIQPKVYPHVKDQYTETGGETGNCVAHAIATAMEVFGANGTSNTEMYSVAYLFGADERSEDNMYIHDALELAVQYGSPRWELVSSHYLDNYSKAESVSLFRNADTYATQNAENQRFSRYQSIDFYDTEAVAEHIERYGAFLFSFRIPENFYTVGRDGIVPQPDRYSGAGHTVALIGAIEKNGKMCWIAQNSWGQSYGDGGRCYIPYDWGCGVMAPVTGAVDGIASWTLDSYAPYPPDTFHPRPQRPSIQAVRQIYGQKSLRVSWTGEDTADTYIVYATPPEDYRVYKKAVTAAENALIDLDGYGNYGVMVLALSKTYRVCSWQSYTEFCEVAEGGGRPVDFAWTNAKISGMDWNITADEWCALCDSVIAFLTYTQELNVQIGTNNLGVAESTTYYELAQKSRQAAVKNANFTAETFNYILYVIGSINGAGTGIVMQRAGNTAYAWLFNRIVDRLNLIQ